MNEDDFKKQFQIDLEEFALKYSLTRLKLQGLSFERDYQLDKHTNRFALKSEKAIIRSHGKTTKIPIGENHQHKTYEEAEKFAKEHWAAYFKKRRQNMSEAERAGYLKRQKRYYQLRKQKELEISKRQ